MQSKNEENYNLKTKPSTAEDADTENTEDRGYTGETLEENEGEDYVYEQSSRRDKSPIAGRMSGSMEQLERIQGTEANSAEVRECLKDSLNCYQTCTKTVLTCLAVDGEYSELKNINLLTDCAKICSSNADFIIRNSTYYPQTCGLTADICDECADMCEKFEDEFMKECASVCRRCSESCREMAR